MCTLTQNDNVLSQMTLGQLVDIFKEYKHLAKLKANLNAYKLRYNFVTNHIKKDCNLFILYPLMY